MRRLGILTIPLLIAISPVPTPAQDGNIMMTVDSIESLLARQSFEVIDRRGSRAEGDRTSRVALSYPDGTVIAAQWADAPRGGEVFNNSPRFELAAYELQKLFLEESEYVVPPTVIRAFPLDWYREVEPRAYPTFRGTGSILVVLQYWLFNVSPDDYWSPDRFATDTLYARHLGNFNIFTYLIRHSDQNTGNYLISNAATNPRVFSVDNGVAFSSRRSDRGHQWRSLRVDRLPARTIARLRALTPDDLVRQLETIAQFRVLDDGTLEPMDTGASIDTGLGVRRSGDIVQLGLTRQEIGEVWGRVQHLLSEVDEGRIEVF